MRTKWFLVFVGGIVFAVAGLAVRGQTTDALSGTWKLDVAKSKYSPGPAPKSNTVKVEANDVEYKIEAQGVDAQGKPTHAHYEAKFDGKDYPVTGIVYADTISVKRVDTYTVEATMKKGGQVTMIVTTTVAPNGKSRTSTFKGKNEKGQDVNNVAVYEKE